jgi:hypothetical protein
MEKIEKIVENVIRGTNLPHRRESNGNGNYAPPRGISGRDGAEYAASEKKYLSTRV